MPERSASSGRRSSSRSVADIDTSAKSWGATTAERRLDFPCDRHLPDADDAYFRAVSVAAPATVMFRWLCQLKLAPYSYDWVDNFGRPSPRELVPGVEHLEIGQRVMTIFRLVDFEADRHLTVLLRRSRLFGDIAGTYLVLPDGDDRCRLVVKLLVKYRGPALVGFVTRVLLPPGDLVMMRRQLLNLKELAEASVSLPASRP